MSAEDERTTKHSDYVHPIDLSLGWVSPKPGTYFMSCVVQDGNGNIVSVRTYPIKTSPGKAQ